MPIVLKWMKLVSIQTVDTFFHPAMTQLLRFGTWDKVISSILCMVMREHQPLLLSPQVAITLPPEDKTQWSWYGRVTLRKLSRSSSRISELSYNQERSPEYQQPSHQPRDQLLELPRILPLKLKRLPPQKSLNLVLQLTWTTTIQQVSSQVTELEEVVKSLPRP